MATMKSLAAVLHDHAVCDRATCVFCNPSLHSEADGLSSVGTVLAPASVVPLGVEGSLLAHTIRVLRGWDERGLAMDLSNAAIRHDAESARAVAMGWADD